MFSQRSPVARHVKQELVNFSMKGLRQEYSKPFRERSDAHFVLVFLRLDAHHIKVVFPVRHSSHVQLCPIF